MRLAWTVLAVLALAGPAGAEDPAPETVPDPEAESDFVEGLRLLDEGTRMLLRGLMERMEPGFRELERALEDLNAYHPPEVLPNGDIILRRKQPLPPPEPGDAPGDGGEIEL